jgi:hypothetical protein|tara:strand:- start:527 stop:817 length:291 start_codon:yes stop_codon:yes gene_type:complete
MPKFSSEKLWREALMIAVKAKAKDGGTKLQNMAAKAVSMAMSGDARMLSEIGDRLDGKPAITSNVEVTDNRTDADVQAWIADTFGAQPKADDGTRH